MNENWITTASIDNPFISLFETLPKYRPINGYHDHYNLKESCNKLMETLRVAKVLAATQNDPNWPIEITNLRKSIVFDARIRVTQTSYGIVWC